MTKRKHKSIPGLVPHPRYGDAPRPSGIEIPEEKIRDGWWSYGREHIFPETVLVADPSKQNFAMYPREYYVDILRKCRKCSRPFIFFALEQRYWFETLQFYVDADCVLCPSCRRESQVIRRRLRRYSDMMSKSVKTRKELMFLVDDGAFLLAQGVLRNLNNLGSLKNMALKSIPEYPGTQLLKESLANARAAQ